MILVFAEQNNGTFKKATYEAVNYAAKVAAASNDTVTALVLGECSTAASLGEYGAHKVIHISDARLNHLDAKAYSKAIASVASEGAASILVFSNNITAKAVAPRVSARLKAGLISGAISLPDTANGFVVKRGVFSGKAFAYAKINSEMKIVAITPNSFGVEKMGQSAEVETHSMEFSAQDFSIKVENVQTVSGIVPLSEAELVVSGGRGLKGPENWGILEDMASSLGATLACSRPVADSHWRPHHEHVGQTGGTIRPNLYIAVGISGAIQHLAGVNSSKTIVVINKDPEAPFFKAADYGVLGDAFEIVPKLTAAFKKFKAAQNA
ncbi:MAG: electron transfer flavoprotein subunit alpha/FixB family protein [Chitinophagaceae bacterium]|nr:electron transfer flavoprotein subunit alpha/FixB family protein [Chitinophagaceae bacterium]